MPDETRAVKLRAFARTAAPYIGGVLAVISVVIVVRQIATLATELEAQLADWSIWPGVLGFSVLYGFALFVLGIAWSVLIPGVSTSRRALLRVYGVSSLSKYLPGNIFHFAGRQLLGARLGLAQASMAIATLFEIILSVLTSLLVATTLMAFVDVRPAGITPAHAAIVWAGLIAFVAALELQGIRAKLFERFRTTPPDRGALTVASMCCASFFLSSALIAMGVNLLLDGTVDNAVLIGAAYVLAWVVGYVVPGVPGGIGVREAAVIGILSPVVPPATALAVALIMRLVTTLGDVVFASACYLLLPAPQRA